jgi:hypothetical protein
MIGVWQAALASADESRGLQPVHARHVDVEQHHGEIPVEQALQRLLARAHGDEIVTEVLEYGAHDQQVFRPVVDNQYARPLAGRVRPALKRR